MTIDSGKDTSVVLLLNDERLSKSDIKEGKGGEGEKNAGEGEEKDGEDKSEGGEEKKEVRVGGEEVLAEVDPPKYGSWLKNKTELRLWIGEIRQL